MCESTGTPIKDEYIYDSQPSGRTDHLKWKSRWNDKIQPYHLISSFFLFDYLKNLAILGH